jgi:phytoene desaturase
MQQGKTAIVIGSGIAGMATAIRLSAQGYAVRVFDAAPTPGGKLAQMHLNGYRFDIGPSLFTLPYLVEELFTLCGKNMANYLAVERLDTICRYFFSNGKVLNAYADSAKFAAEAQAVTGEPAANVIAHLQHSKRLWQLTANVFIFNAFGGLKTYLSKPFLKSALSIGQMDVLKTMHQANSQRFKTPEMVQLFNRYATYNGSSPYKAPGVLNVIPHVEYGLGAYLPKKGIYSIVEALHQLATEQGVQFTFNTKVDSIIVENNCATGIVANGTQHLANVVVSNADVAVTYRHLLGDDATATKILKHERSTSALVFNWGIKKEFPQLDLHNIFFAEDYQAEFESLFDKKQIYADPTIYVFISSKHVKADTPAGGENWFVMVNAPQHSSQNWDAIAAQTRQVVIAKLSKHLGQDITPYIDCEWVLTPQLIESRTSSLGGALYGSSSNSRFAAFFRHKNYSNKIKQLYFCGGSVHPGGGIPICLASAKITAQTIEKDNL